MKEKVWPNFSKDLISKVSNVINSGKINYQFLYYYSSFLILFLMRKVSFSKLKKLRLKMMEMIFMQKMGKLFLKIEI